MFLLEVTRPLMEVTRLHVLFGNGDPLNMMRCPYTEGAIGSTALTGSEGLHVGVRSAAPGPKALIGHVSPVFHSHLAAVGPAQVVPRGSALSIP